MSIPKPLTASYHIQSSLVPKIVISDNEYPLKSNLGIFSSDIVEISILGIEKQQKEAQLEVSREVKDIAN